MPLNAQPSVNCELGIRILNACDVSMYNNTLVNNTACLSRSERSAVGDHFGWHPATGPQMKNYQPVPSVGVNAAASALPASIIALLKLNEKTPPYVGAYPMAR